MRVAVYSDLEYSRAGDAVFARESFALFAAALREHVDRLVLVGRVDPRARAGMPHPLPPGTELLELPFYPSLTDPRQFVQAVGGSLTRFWRLLDQVDVAWVLGPHPLGIAFALIAHARERRVVLGVRQDTLSYIRHRHPGRLGLRLAAWALELTWRGLTRFDATVVVGEDLARRYRGSRTLVPIAVSLIDDADLADADTVLARPYDGDLRVLSVGRLDPEKNPLLLADVLARLRAFDPRWRLVVCGDGSERQALEARLRSHGLAAHAELRGAVPFDELRAAYATSHAVLHVSWTEGVPQVLFEAFAAGVPVVATDVGGVAAAVGDAALLVPPGAPEAAAHGLARIAGDAALRAELVVRGLERARDRTLRSQLERVVAVLERDARREPSVSHARLAEVA